MLKITGLGESEIRVWKHYVCVWRCRVVHVGAWGEITPAGPGVRHLYDWNQSVITSVFIPAHHGPCSLPTLPGSFRTHVAGSFRTINNLQHVDETFRAVNDLQLVPESFCSMNELYGGVISHHK